MKLLVNANFMTVIVPINELSRSPEFSLPSIDNHATSCEFIFTGKNNLTVQYLSRCNYVKHICVICYYNETCSNRCRVGTVIVGDPGSIPGGSGFFWLCTLMFGVNSYLMRKKCKLLERVEKRYMITQTKHICAYNKLRVLTNIFF